MESTGVAIQEPATPLTREALYSLVWSEPMLKVAARFEVSSSYMARVCTRMNVPRPDRGYWAKKEVGKAPKQTPLPEARPGDKLIWARDGESIRLAKPLPKPPTRIVRKNPPSTTSALKQHPLVTDVKPLFESGRLSYDVGYLKPAKRLLVDLTVTSSALEKALKFANELFLALEAHGHRVVIAPNGEHLHRVGVDEREKPGRNRGYNNLWSPGRCTVVYIGTVAIGLSILEMSEEALARYVSGNYIRDSEHLPPKRGRYSVDHTWTTTKDFPTGRLCLHAYSPYPRAKWGKQWRESKDSDLTNVIPKIVKELEHQATEVARLVEEGERQAEIEHKRWEEEMAEWKRRDAEKRAAQARKDSKDELLQIIEMWAGSKRLEAFFADAVQKLPELPEDKRVQVADRLQRARDLIGSVDALEHFLRWRAPEER